MNCVDPSSLRPSRLAALVPGLLLAAAVLLAAPSRAGAQTIILDSFNTGSVVGSVDTSTTWNLNTTLTGTALTVGGTARDDNGWRAVGQSINATGMNFVAVTAKLETGHVASQFVIEFADSSLNTSVFSVATSSFTGGGFTTVYFPLTSWDATDFADIVRWKIGGGGVGTDAFRMSIDHLALTASAIPEPSTYAALFGAAVLGFAFWRRRTARTA